MSPQNNSLKITAFSPTTKDLSKKKKFFCCGVVISSCDTMEKSYILCIPKNGIAEVCNLKESEWLDGVESILPSILWLLVCLCDCSIFFYFLKPIFVFAVK